MHVRPATSADVAAIAEILWEVGWFPYMDKEAPEATEVRIAKHLKLCDADDSHTVLVGEGLGGEILGYAVVHWLPYLMLPEPEGYLSEVFVREGERGRGVGRRLLEEVKAQAMARGCWRLMLINGRHRESYERGFYRKLGWEERPHIANFVLILSDEC
jgi:GNAT superfamily N-acetyltransferase